MFLNLPLEEFLNNAEKFTNHPLNKKDDVRKIISTAVELKKEEEFSELAFTAKYIKGLMRVVNKAPGIPEVESIDHVKTDITENMKKVIEQFRTLLKGSEESTIDFFEESYLSLNQDSFNNLNLMLADLESVKKYLNHLKHLK
ncbi:MAG: hypothetical protein KJN64_14565 [Ignavibacteria bacterium]|nr:hypothetical protein [Ignavibacteria bacterium]MBT8380915.1 hypothetical protein [Ignavibacteria bacterium]MBT8391491.1 hypothetical protein [Ignavibacteria bacterium]NNJ54154.1 hypothetical protein [Ignavibacteriaceae bacterium]